MDNLIGFLLFISFFSLIIGLVRPDIFKNIFKGKKVNRKFIFKIFGLTTVALFFVLGMVTEPTQNLENQKINKTGVSPLTQVENKKNGKEVDPVISNTKKVQNESNSVVPLNLASENITTETPVEKTDSNIVLPVTTAPKIEESLPEPVVNKTVTESNVIKEDTSVKVSPIIPLPVYPAYVSEIEEPIEVTDSCCKHCSTGKACGDSCISRSYTCHKGPGCACDY